MSKQKYQKTSRSQARALAFQILYSLEFTSIHSLGDLRQAFVSAPRVKVTYSEPELEDLDITPENEEDTMVFLPKVDSLPAHENDTVEDTNENVIPTGFAWELVDGVWSNVDEIDSTIKEYAKNWKINRLGRIELTVLRIALFEMLYRDDIPAKVSITEALELTNQFAEFKARSFINGLLDAVHKNKLKENS